MLKRLFRHAAVLPFLGVFVWLAVAGSDQVGATTDEAVHIVSGLYYNQEGDYRFQPENGNLPQRLHAIPWMLARVRAPALSGSSWENADIWALGEKLMLDAGPRSFSLHRQSRLINACAGALVLIVVYAWTRSALGASAAWLSLSLAAFCPTLVAHSGLSTTDTWGVLGALLAALAWWRLCHRVTPGRILLAGLAAGFFALCKFNCVLFAPAALSLAGLRLLRRAPLPAGAGARIRFLRGWRRLPALSAGAAMAVLVAWGTVWSAYGFRYEASPVAGTRFVHTWEDVLVEDQRAVGLTQLGDENGAHQVKLRRGMLQEGVSWARERKILPEAWLFGLAYVGKHSQSRLSYLAGEYRMTGWRTYFPIAFALKTPLGGMIALVAGAAAWFLVKRPGRPSWRLSAALVLAVVLGAAAVSSRINIGVRHILPVIVVLWMTAGAVFLVRRPRLRMTLAGIAVLGAIGQAVSTIRVAPHALTYFNPLAGDSPDRWLADSNLDWGQGLPELKTWLDGHADGQPVYLSYFGTDTPSRYDIQATRFADHMFDFSPKVLPVDLKPGVYCFGPTQFRRVYSVTRGPWTAERERLYQRILAQVIALGDPAARETSGLSADALLLMLKDFDALRLARLTLYLEGRAPDHRLPGGMMIYRLSAEDLETAFYRPLPGLVSAVRARLARQPSGDDPSR